MGWNDLAVKQASPLTDGLDGQAVYFVHSYFTDVPSQYIDVTSDYSIEVPAMIHKDNVYGAQFHPEKFRDIRLRYFLKSLQGYVKLEASENKDFLVRRMVGEMQILPAIDIKDGQAVRLFKGDFNQQTVVNPDVIEQAKTFKDAGIQFIHVVDLDGALDGRATNRDLIAEVKTVSGLGIEVGGGIRTWSRFVIFGSWHRPYHYRFNGC